MEIKPRKIFPWFLHKYAGIKVLRRGFLILIYNYAELLHKYAESSEMWLLYFFYLKCTSFKCSVVIRAIISKFKVPVDAEFIFGIEVNGVSVLVV